MLDEEIYKAAIDFLLSFDSITQFDLEQHLISEFEKPKDLKIIYKRLCESAQNRQMSSKVIGNAIGGVENLQTVLFNFDCHKVAKTYNKTDSKKLLNEIRKKLKPLGQVRTTNRSLWPQFCQSLIDSAHFLKSFKSAEDFYEWTDLFKTDSKIKPALPLLISIEITGIGFPLACDFLKELGFVEFGKPDVHLKDIFKSIDLIDKNEKSTAKQDFAVLKVIDRIAEVNNVTPYAVDKVFWLIGSGNFYKTNKSIGKQKHNFTAWITSII